MCLLTYIYTCVCVRVCVCVCVSPAARRDATAPGDSRPASVVLYVYANSHRGTTVDYKKTPKSVTDNHKRTRASSHTNTRADCESGKHAPANESAECVFCGENQLSTADGVGCACIAGRYHDPAARGSQPQCPRCPPGTACLQPGETLSALPIEPGHWRSATNPGEVLSCPVPAACLGRHTHSHIETHMHEFGRLA